MKQYIFLFIFLAALSTCSPEQEKEQPVELTVAADAPDTTKINNYSHDSLRELNSFYVNINYLPLEQIIEDVSKRRNTQTITKKDFCWGDCCGISKSLRDSMDRSDIYLFKSECGEYGFGNDQFYFIDNLLTMARSFNYHIDQFPTDSTSAIFRVEEIICDFTGDKLVFKHRKTFTGTHSHRIIHIKFQDSIADIEKLRKEKTEEFEQLLELENKKD